MDERADATVNALSISATLPAYNEEPNLDGVVRELVAALAAATPDFEVIIVDDGSEDGTPALADRLAAQDPRVKAIHHPENRGYGAALSSGFCAAARDWLFFMDADGQFDPRELEQFIPLARTHDFIAGYRRTRQDPWHRRAYGKVFSALVRRLFGVRVRDVNCAFKLFKKNLIAPERLVSRGALINAEILYQAKKRGVDPVELPVSHRPRKSGHATGGNPRVILTAALELIRLRLKK